MSAFPQNTETYTSTGTKTAIEIPERHKVSFGVYDNNGNVATADVEIQLVPNGGWFSGQTAALALGEAYAYDTPVNAIRVNITDLDTATEVYLDYTAYPC